MAAWAIFKRTLAFAVLAAMTSGGAIAGSFEQSKAAYAHGDYATALRLVRPLAEQGDAKGQAGLGIMYKNGQGVAQDYAGAVKWFGLLPKRAMDQCTETPRSSFVRRVCYDEPKSFMVIKLDILRRARTG